MRKLPGFLLLIGLLTVGVHREVRAGTRIGLDVGAMGGKTESVVETTSGKGSAAVPRETAGGVETRLGAVGDHYVAGVSLTAWGATSSVGSIAAYGGLAARSRQGFAVELTGSLGGQSYDGYVSGGLYSDVTTTAVVLPVAAGHLQVWAPLGRTTFLGLFAEARTDLGRGTGTATITQRCGALCEIFGGMVSPPELHTFAVGGQGFFVGLNLRFSADAQPTQAEGTPVDD